MNGPARVQLEITVEKTVPLVSFHFLVCTCAHSFPFLFSLPLYSLFTKRRNEGSLRIKKKKHAEMISNDNGKGKHSSRRVDVQSCSAEINKNGEVKNGTFSKTFIDTSIDRRLILASHARVNKEKRTRNDCK